ncbi:TauD/TfdA dioxygenase family protein [Streptomyces pseudovenezuelae]|uniref:TauD/TfdA dioxygenase family protein n=1 Tax=Streptomyces pseudovenezuelae TaxID=67350 RepID=UPI002E81A2ED|nr:TauD/TfdA family dioxygenase [Streptomyces pseudovenezuelae]WUA85919.1 TauD/TfdA family dioxygenase [Streptomyces pseudovenezuelae]
MEQFALDAIERITTRKRHVYDTLGVEPLTPLIGAEVSGLDLSKDLTPEQDEEIRHAFLTHHVLIFRDQNLTPDEHKRFAQLFGALHPVALPTPDSDPYVLEISANQKSRWVAGDGWHVDGTADAEPSLGSMLHVTSVPEAGSGGDTLFANMHLAYDLLSPAMKTFLTGLTALHDGALPWLRKGQSPPRGYDVPRNEHPIVVRHPDTGRQLLLVNKPYMSRITQLSETESTAVLDLLYAHVARTPLLHCRVRWQPNTLVFWDNRCVQHHAVWDYFPHARHGRRVSVRGTRPQA